MTASLRDVRPSLPRPRPNTVVWGSVAVAVQVVLILTYAQITGRFADPSFLAFPVVWITVGLWALVRVEPPAAPRRRRRIAGALAVGYFLVLAAVSGMFAPGEVFGGNPALGLELRLYRPAPGWTPALVYNGSLLHVSLLPPYVVGLSALSYLVYARLLVASGVAGVGLVGLFSCVSCTLPLVTALLAGAAGVSAGALLAAVAPVAYELGMVAFVATVAVLAWQPAVGGGSGSGTDARARE